MENQLNESMGKVNGALKDFRPHGKNPDMNLEKVSREIGQTIGTSVKKFSDSVSEYSRAGTKYVSENPVRGAAIAAATGALIGGLVALTYRRGR